jgi:CheY-like chemotaxis protein
MPGLNGRDVYEQLAESHPDRAGRIVFMTGDVANEATQEFIRQHRCTVISKPFTLREFHRTFERMLPT